jgi:hypothetical protein
MSAVEARNYFQHERPGTPEAFYLGIARKNFEIIKRNVHPDTGLFREYEFGVENPEQASIGGTSEIVIGLIEASKRMKKLPTGGELATEIDDFVKDEVGKLLTLLDNPRWTDKFNQDIIKKGHFYTTFADSTKGAPEVHLNTDGKPLEGQNQNQPYAWGKFLMMVGRANRTGIIKEYTQDELDQNGNVAKTGQLTLIKQVAGYLLSIQPGDFECIAMGGDVPMRLPAPRSSALAMIDGLGSARHLFTNDPDFQDLISDTIFATMTFIKRDVNTDRIDPKQSDGASFPMLRTVIMHNPEDANISAIDYITNNSERLGISVSPASKMCTGDEHDKNWDSKVKIGEARHLVSPDLVIAYSRAVHPALKDFIFHLNDAYDYISLAQSRFRQALKVIRCYGYPPDTFIPTDSASIPPGVTSWTEVDSDEGENVVFVPKERSSIMNRSMMVWAAAELAYARQEFKRVQSLGIDFS